MKSHKFIVINNYCYSSSRRDCKDDEGVRLNNSVIQLPLTVYCNYSLNNSTVFIYLFFYFIG